jgi:hypothetical protein
VQVPVASARGPQMISEKDFGMNSEELKVYLPKLQCSRMSGARGQQPKHEGSASHRKVYATENKTHKCFIIFGKSLFIYLFFFELFLINKAVLSSHNGSIPA